MHRSVAFVAFLALSWSQLVGLRCDMGTDRSMTAAHASTPASHAPAEHATTGADAHDPPDHGGGHDCLMIMACGFASVRQARPAAMIRFPAVFVAAAFLNSPIPRRCRPGSRDSPPSPHGVTNRAPPGAPITPQVT